MCSCTEKPEVDVDVSLHNSPHYYFIIFYCLFIYAVYVPKHTIWRSEYNSQTSVLSPFTNFILEIYLLSPAGHQCIYLLSIPCSSILFCETRSLTEPGTSQLPELAGQRTQGISLSHAPHTGVTDMHSHVRLLHGCSGFELSFMQPRFYPHSPREEAFPPSSRQR